MVMTKPPGHKMTNSTKTAVVTGVSTGLGFTTAKMLLDHGWRVFGSVRKLQDAVRLSDAYPEKFTPLVFDVTDRGAIDSAAETVTSFLNGRTLDALVNNAGMAVSGPLRHIPIDELKFQFDVNVFGMINVCQAFIPLLGADKKLQGKPGKIINLSSVHGKMAMPIFGPYSMSKHAVEALSGSLRRELLMHGIDVVIVAPGAVNTPIWEKADNVDVEQYKDTEYYYTFVGIQKAAGEIGNQGLRPETVAAKILKVINSPKSKTRYALVASKFANWTLPRLLPTRLVDKTMTKRMGFPSKAP